MLLVVTYSVEARATLRNVCQAHEDTVARRFGRAVLLHETQLGAFLALRLQAKHGGDVQIDRTRPLNEYADVPRAVREAAEAYESRDVASTPYHAFAAGTAHPSPETLRTREL